ncbi:MAG: hypothetical protein KBS81_04970, partial [Spirochaetales bacterium]|nr:hypothetical protein [Candidatus Physcosoma equi]
MSKKCFLVLLLFIVLFLSSCASTKHQHSAFYYKTVAEATCMEKGSREVYCGLCQKKVGTEEIPATGNHLYGTSKSLKAPTCLEEGLVEHTCTKCGYTFQDPSAPNGHSYS